MGKTINFFGKKNHLKKGFPGDCFLRCGVCYRSFGAKKMSIFAISVAVIATGK